LCGVNSYSGQSYEHRRAWVKHSLLFLFGVFAIDVCAYGVMNKHTHGVVLVDKDSALSWSFDEVLNHYYKLHKGTLLTQKHLRGEELSSGEIISFAETVEIYRARLYDISGFMCDLNE
jgi:hypothetical protein